MARLSVGRKLMFYSWKMLNGEESSFLAKKNEKVFNVDMLKIHFNISLK